MRQLYLTNLPYDCTEPELKTWAESQGVHVVKLNIVRDTVSGASPSFACIQIDTESDFAGAIEGLDGRDLRGQTISVTEAPPTPKDICRS